ncbi:RDD family protein [Jeotgalibacillus marinus]|uniref:RDD family protein n=1 Tax=Jeotgalibacillus marinus TaxID=86667 RepID=A0ABV3Q1J9_9BACL
MNHKDERSLEPSAPLAGQQVGNEEYEQRSVVDKPNPVLTPHYGGFWMRVWAYLFDVLVIAAINGLLVYPVFRIIGIANDGGMFSVVNIVTTITYFAYFVLMTKFLGQTLGKMIFGLKVITLKREDLGWSTVVFRELIGRYIHTALVILTFPLYLVVAFTPKKQGIHDFIADTTVIHERTVLVKPAMN